MAGHCGARVMAAPLARRAAGTARGVCSAAAERPWRLFGAMCLLRLPRITQPLEKEEEEVAALMEQVEGDVRVLMGNGALSVRGEEHQGLARTACDVAPRVLSVRFAPHLVGVGGVPMAFLHAISVPVAPFCSCCSTSGNSHCPRFAELEII